MATRGKADVATLAYLAGIIDGEGHIGINVNLKNPQRRTSPRYQSELVIVNSDKPLFEWLAENFGGAVGPRKKAEDHHKQTWRWKVGDKQAATILEAVLPYLRIKRKQAELLIEFVREGAPKPAGMGARLTEAELKRRQRIYREIAVLNDRRRRPQRLSEEAPESG